MKRTYVLACAVVAFALSAALASAQESSYIDGCDSCNACDSCSMCTPECFQGFYIGGNIGVFSHRAVRNDTDGFLTDNSGWSLLDTSEAVGIQIGYDWQQNNHVLGLVADWNSTDLHSLIPNNPNGTPSDSFVFTDLDWFTSIRLRAGLTVCDTLVYVSAGPVVAEFDTVWQDLNNSPQPFEHSGSRWGWMGTVGTEIKWSCNTSFGLELYYMQFPDEYVTFTSTDPNYAADYTFGHNDAGYGARFLLNYRFGHGSLR